MIRRSLMASAMASAVALMAASLCFFEASSHFASAQQSSAAPNRVLGTVSTVSGRNLNVKTDTGSLVTVSVTDSTRILRTVPGQKTLAGATRIGVDEIAPGDRVLAAVAGSAPPFTASTIIVNKQVDLAQRQQAQEADWQRRGAGGIVKSVDPATGVITLTSGRQIVTVKVVSSTILRRYAPDSVKFSDAKASAIGEIHPGDQIMARGDRSVDGGEVTAEEIVSGSFRNIAGPVISSDSSSSTITVKDLFTKKSLVIHVTPDSDLRKLDPEMAQMIALRLKPAPPGNGPPGGDPTAQRQNMGAPAPAGGSLARVLERAPKVSVSDLHKGDAVMIVATQGNPDSAVAIRLVAGVEPMLEASARGSENMLSSAWNLGGGAEEGAGQGTP